MEDMVFLIRLMGITGLGSAIIGYLTSSVGYWYHIKQLNLSLTLGYFLGFGLTLFNVWITARMMFLNQHDLQLASVLLLFAGGISVSFGILISNSITSRLGDIVKAAHRIKSGDLSTRLVVHGTDEVSELAKAFNDMAGELENVNELEKSLEKSRRDLVAWASHDLRTPLTSLRAMLDALADGVVEDPETTQEYLKKSKNEVYRMSMLLNNLFELAQLDAGYIEHRGEYSSIRDLISDSLESLSIHAEKRGVKLSGHTEPGIDPVWMAADKISRVLQNLIENALRFTSSGGEVKVNAKMRGDDEILITVSDTGEGISPEEIEYIFERFYRGEKSRSREGYELGGTGLGLAITKGLVESHGGEIWVESEPGKGTTFFFSISKVKPA